MTLHWLFQWAVLAVLVSWVIGAHHRLLRLRGAVVAAWSQIEPALQRRSEAMAVVVEAMRGPLAGEAVTLQALADADARQRLAADAVRPTRARAAEVSEWVAAEAALASPASRLKALIELQSPLLEETADPAALRAALAAWAAADTRIQFSRQSFNDAAQLYDRALHQWPTRLLSTPFGFRMAGRI